MTAPKITPVGYGKNHSVYRKISLFCMNHPINFSFHKRSKRTGRPAGYCIGKIVFTSGSDIPLNIGCSEDTCPSFFDLLKHPVGAQRIFKKDKRHSENGQPDQGPDDPGPESACYSI